LSQEKTKAFKPNHITRRITAQSGWFTTHKYVIKKENFVPIDTQLAYVNKLTRLEFDNDLRDIILNRLDNFGINASSMFPDLDGLTAYLNWSHDK